MSDKILDLSTEVTLNILSRLSAKEIQRSRAVCRHFRDLIDEPSNKTLLATPGQQRSLYALNLKLARGLLFEDCYSDMIECLDRFLDLNGLWPNNLVIDSMFIGFEHYWMQQMAKVIEDEQLAANSPEIRDTVWFVATSLVKTHLKLHGYADFDDDIDALIDQPDVYAEEFATTVMGMFGEEVTEAIGFTKDVLKKWFREVITTPGGRFSAVARPTSERMQPAFPLTELGSLYLDAETGEMLSRAKKGLCSHDALAQILGLARVRYGVYYVRTETAYNQVKSAVGGEEMNAVVKAAVLEEIEWSMVV